MSTKARIWLAIIGALIIVGGGLTIIVTKNRDKNDKPADSAQSQPSSGKHYVALGDSVAAGVGLMNDSDPSACNRTDQSYPKQLAKRQNYQLTNLACSGATLAAGINGAQTVNGLAVTPQLDQLFGGQQPDVITLTIGANDVGWSRFIASCYTGNCNSPASAAAFSQQLDGVEAAYKQTLQRLISHYTTGTPPKIVVTDYYHIFPAAAASCADTAGVDAGEQQWVRQQVMLLNNTIERAVQSINGAQAGKVSLAEIDYTSHEVCSSDPWVQSINDRQPFHPTANGQAAIAKQLATTIAK